MEWNGNEYYLYIIGNIVDNIILSLHLRLGLGLDLLGDMAKNLCYG